VRHQATTVERELARLAAGSHGVVTRAQLLRAGITLAEIRQRLHTGALLREHRGVYRVGHRAPSAEARYLAAVWACGESAVLSGRAAAHLLGILNGPPPEPEVTLPSKRRVDGITTRRSERVEATTWRAIRVTTVARTLVDLAAVLPLDALARACHAWEQDRRREREARARGDEFRRYTYGDVTERPRLMLAELEAPIRQTP
jgi:hypothetical protein